MDWGQRVYLTREVVRRPGDAGVLLGSSLILRSAFAGLAVILTMLTVRLLGYEMRIQHLTGLSVACLLPLALSQPYGYLFRGRDRMDLDAMVSARPSSARPVFSGAVPERRPGTGAGLWFNRNRDGHDVYVARSAWRLRAGDTGGLGARASVPAGYLPVQLRWPSSGGFRRPLPG